MNENLDAFYFQHDFDARKDPKCSALFQEFGCEGYGVYWCIIETCYEQGGKIKKFPKLLDGLAFQFNISVETITKQIEAMLHDFELLREDDKYIWSDRVLRNLEEREKKRQKKAEAGRIGGIQSGIERSKSKQIEATVQANEANEAKERKGKEIKQTTTQSFAQVLNKQERPLKERFVKWLGVFDDVESPEGLADFYFKKYKPELIERAFKNPQCTSRSEFVRIVNGYMQPEKKQKIWTPPA